MARAILLAYAEEVRKRRVLRVQRRRLRDTTDPMQLSDEEFIANFRLNKCGFRQVLEEIDVYLPPIQRKTAVRNEIKVLAALNFFAHGSYQRSVGDSVLNSMSQPTFSKSLRDVINALNAREVILKYIKFPVSLKDRKIIMNEFMKEYGFPGVIGCVSGTHVAILRPTEQELAFYNEQSYYSLNVMIISDANLNIRHVNASFGGDTRDSRVLIQSKLYTIMENLATREESWFLGHSEYRQRPWMMTPILDPAPCTPEEYYNQQHARVWGTVGRCIGVLKARWKCLGPKFLHYDPLTAGKMVNACVILHNIANGWDVPIPDHEPEVHFKSIMNNLDSEQCDDFDEGSPTIDVTRVMLVDKLWKART